MVKWDLTGAKGWWTEAEVAGWLVGPCWGLRGPLVSTGYLERLDSKEESQIIGREVKS